MTGASFFSGSYEALKASTDEYLRRFMDRKAEEKASRVATTATDPDVGPRWMRGSKGKRSHQGQGRNPHVVFQRSRCWFFVMLGLVCVAYLTVKLGRMEVFIPRDTF